MILSWNSIGALESGQVLFFPQLPFVLRAEEKPLLTPSLSSGRAKNISLSPSGKLKHESGDANERAQRGQVVRAQQRRIAEHHQNIVVTAPERLARGQNRMRGTAPFRLHENLRLWRSAPCFVNDAVRTRSDHDRRSCLPGPLQRFEGVREQRASGGARGAADYAFAGGTGPADRRTSSCGHPWKGAAMESISLGMTDLKVSRVAFGAWELGGEGGSFDERRASDAI